MALGGRPSPCDLVGIDEAAVSASMQDEMDAEFIVVEHNEWCFGHRIGMQLQTAIRSLSGREPSQMIVDGVLKPPEFISNHCYTKLCGTLIKQCLQLQNGRS
jgi:hypothetical protein